MIALAFVAAFSLPANAQPSLHEQAQLLGHPLEIRQDATVDQDEAGTGAVIEQETQARLLGHTVDLLKVGLEAGPAKTGAEQPAPAAPPPGVVLNQHDLYIAGVKIWNGAVRFDQGSLVYSGGVAPTQVPIPIFAYPLGPVLLQVDAGVEFEGELRARITPGLSYPLQDSTLLADLSANLYAAAYLEASARLLFLRGGVGGRIDVIDSSAGFRTVLALTPGYKPHVQSYGYARLLSGHVYGFVDFKLFFGRWNRLLRHDFFNWSGKTFNFQPNTSPWGT